MRWNDLLFRRFWKSPPSRLPRQPLRPAKKPESPPPSPPKGRGIAGGVCNATLPPWTTPRGAVIESRVGCPNPFLLNPFLPMCVEAAITDPPVVLRAGAVEWLGRRSLPVSPTAARRANATAPNTTRPLGGGQNVLVQQYQLLREQHQQLKEMMRKLEKDAKDEREALAAQLSENSTLEREQLVAEAIRRMREEASPECQQVQELRRRQDLMEAAVVVVFVVVLLALAVRRLTRACKGAPTPKQLPTIPQTQGARQEGRRSAPPIVSPP
eukprot:Hpha_TRINITY_DN23009_c0_g1::TRINITY_DN23009_c0_g1_i1::g.109316::m.109316